MISKLWQKLGELNPQLHYEFKKRFKFRNLLITVGLAIFFQALLLLFISTSNKIYPSHLGQQELEAINQSLWSIRLFIRLSQWGIVALLVPGTYLLITDLAREQKRETLDLIRWSPQSVANILWGKILGVPILVYSFAALALPLHLILAFLISIPPGAIALYYLSVILSCAFFYSLALLYTFLSFGLKGLQPWLGSGAVLALFLLKNNFRIFHFIIQWFMPIPALSRELALSSHLPEGYNLYLPRYSTTNTPLAFIIVLVSTYWIWQGLKRRFYNPSSTIFSKKQSYFFCACYGAIVTFGILPFQLTLDTNIMSHSLMSFDEWQIGNLFFWLCLILAIAPRSAHLEICDSSKKIPLIQALLYGEDSPAIVVIALNFGIIALFALAWLLLGMAARPDLLPVNLKPSAIEVALNFGWILIIASLIHIFLKQNNRNRRLWLLLLLGFSIPASILSLASRLLSIGASEPQIFVPFLTSFSLWHEAISLKIVAGMIFGQWLAIALLNHHLLRRFIFATPNPTIKGKKASSNHEIY